MKPARMSFGAATATILLALLCAVQLLAVLRAPAAWLPREIAVQLQPGESIVLGRAELGAPRAAARQLTLRRDIAGAWWLRNLEPVQPIVLRRGDARADRLRADIDHARAVVGIDVGQAILL